MRMTFRNMERRPWRAALTTLGIAGAMAIVVSGPFWRDALDYMIDVQFSIAQRADAQVALTEPMPSRSQREIERLPGVLQVEAAREFPARLVAGHHSNRTIVEGLPAAGRLRRLLDGVAMPVALPHEGILPTDRLTQRLDVRPGDRIGVDFLTGERRHVRVSVAGTSADLIGLAAYTRLPALTRLAGAPDTLSSFSVQVDRTHEDAFFRALKAYPRIATVASKAAMLQNFRDTMARNVLFFTTVLTIFAAVIAVGVAYNNARVALQERAWEPASLRVLGFTRGEVSLFLLGELAFELALALPLGCGLRYALAWTMVKMTHSDLLAIPLVIAPRTYALAALAWALYPKPTPVDVATVAHGTFVKTIDEDGKTRVRKRYLVSAPLWRLRGRRWRWSSRAPSSRGRGQPVRTSWCSASRSTSLMMRPCTSIMPSWWNRENSRLTVSSLSPRWLPISSRVIRSRNSVEE